MKVNLILHILCVQNYERFWFYYIQGLGTIVKSEKESDEHFMKLIKVCNICRPRI